MVGPTCSMSVSTRLQEARKRVAHKDEAIRKKLEAELSRKRNSSPASSQNVARRVALKGTLAALKPTFPLKVPEKTTIGDATQLCVAKRADCFLVVDEKGVTGIVTSKDLVYRVVAEGLDPRTTSVRQIMTRNPVVTDGSATASQALEQMLTKKFRHLPIRGEDGDIFGILDISKIFHDALATAHRRSSASEQLFNAMAGIEAELGSEGSQSEIFSWAAKLRERTTLPDLASAMGSTTQPVTVGPKASVREVAQLMKERGISAVCVMEDATPASLGAARRIPRIVGIFTSKDILLRVLAPALDALRCSVVRVMTPQPDTAHLTMTVHDTVKKMYDGHFLHMPVVEDDGRLVAVVNIYSLAAATHDQIITASQEVSAPEAVGTIVNRFFEPISRSGTPLLVDPLFSRVEKNSDRQEQFPIHESFVNTSSIHPMRRSVSPPPTSLTTSFSALGEPTTEITSPKGTISSVHTRQSVITLPRIFTGTQSSSVYISSASEANPLSPNDLASPLSSIMSPTLDDTIYVFKFIAPSGMAYRFKARQDDYKQFSDSVTEKLQADPFFDINFYPDPSLCPDPKDLSISYEDEDGDAVMITADQDVADAVRVFRKAGKDRVVLNLQGGKSWAPIVAVEEKKSVPIDTSADFDKSDVVQVLVESSIPSLDHIAEPLPPEYSPNDRWNASVNFDTFGLGPSREHTTYDLRPSHLGEAKNHSLEKLLSIRAVLDELEETRHAILAQRNDRKRVDSNRDLGSIGNSSWQVEHIKPKDNIRALVIRLGTVFDSVGQFRRLLDCAEGDTPRLLDMLQTLLDVPGLSTQFRRHLLVATQRLSRRTGLYPTCYNLENIEMVSEHPVAAGGFADVHKGRFLGQVVCLKVLRIYQSSELQSFLKHFSAEAILWGQLSHLNLLPIYGLYRYNERLCLVAPWMEYGDITQFLKEHPDENRGLLVLDVGSGIAYLHTHDIVHGDLKGANILVNGCRRACLADFGLSSVTDSTILHWTSHSSVSSKGGSIRWQAPELFDSRTDEVVQNTKASDVYAFSCVGYEIFTGNVPFFEHPRDSAVMLKVSSGEKPSRPPPSSIAWGPWGLTEAVWLLMESCWSTNQSQRPSIYDVVSKHSSTILMDDRPLENGIILSPADFRDSVGGRAPLPSVEEIEEILDRAHN